MNRFIEVTVSPNGETSIQTKGYVGSDCLQASKFLEQALGVVAKESKTGDFYQAAQAEERVEQAAPVVQDKIETDQFLAEPVCRA